MAGVREGGHHVRPWPQVWSAAKRPGFLVTLALICLWTSSYWSMSNAAVRIGSHWARLSSLRGGLWLGGGSASHEWNGRRWVVRFRWLDEPDGDAYGPSPRLWRPQWRLQKATLTREYYWEGAIPYWMPVAVLVTVRGVLLWKAARIKRPHRCGACGHSTLGLPAGALCPECGRGAA